MQALWTYRIDAALWPLAVVASIVAFDEPLALLCLIPVLWLLHTFSHERRERYDAALELNRAYRGTVMLLSDVVEADDNYTADHCRGVVTLVTAVADELEIEPDARQELEFAALLHDVGKIVIPKEILNKPGALTEQEFELMKTHTIEGQVLLDRVGGLLGRVGSLVRSCHERWDGNGYPDGLAGYEIPLPARIVFACDAYSAMTTDRPYRAAMSQETALEELWANAGTQFDPRVVSALATVIRNGTHVESSPALDVQQVLARNAAIIGGPRAQLSLSARPLPRQ
jgi:HD-GYP domain-containing protein (c-di-GMP phosphodiesterase class II)